MSYPIRYSLARPGRPFNELPAMRKKNCHEKYLRTKRHSIRRARAVPAALRDDFPGATSLATMTAIAALMALPRAAFAGPTGGAVVEGSAGISQVGTTTNINQSSNKAIINWQGFSIAPQETVNFNQPSSAAATLNRVIGNEKSIISGALNANGQVFIVNSAGILFNKSAEVNVGGLVASTLDVSNQDFMAGNYRFSGTSAASVVNQGKIHAGQGGYVALLGKTVSNDGVISATLGTVAMASGNKITLNFDGNSLIDVTIDEGTLNALVENKRAIKADGGRVIMTAKAADSVLSAQVNNSGIVQARTMAALKGGSGAQASVHVGSIKILASGGTAQVSGKLDASAPKGGKGGTIETSGNKVNIADSVVITTKASGGENGTWLIDPDGFTIAANGDMTGATLTSQLANGNVTIQSKSGSGTDGNININDAVSWAANTLTLNATNNIYVNAVMTATGTANLVANYGTGTNADHTAMGLYTLQSAGLQTSSQFNKANGFAGQINFSGSGKVTLNGSNYTVINTLADLTAAANNLSGNYVLGSNLTYSVAWPTPIGSVTQPFTGSFNGFGHQIKMTAAAATQTGGTGLFGVIGNGATVSNLAVSATLGPNPNNKGKGQSASTVNTDSIGILADVNHGNIFNSSAVGSVAVESTAVPDATVDNVGGLVGDNSGLIVGSYTSASVPAILYAGGLVGTNEASRRIYTSSVQTTLGGVTNVP